MLKNGTKSLIIKPRFYNLYDETWDRYISEVYGNRDHPSEIENLLDVIYKHTPFHIIEPQIKLVKSGKSFFLLQSGVLHEINEGEAFQLYRTLKIISIHDRIYPVGAPLKSPMDSRLLSPILKFNNFMEAYFFRRRISQYNKNNSWVEVTRTSSSCVSLAYSIRDYFEGYSTGWPM